MNLRKPLGAKGFTLVELISVLVIVSVIAVTVAIRLPSLNQDLATAKNQVLYALHYARVVALSQATTDNSVVVTLNTTSIDLQLDATSLELIAVNYPEALPSSISVQNGTGTIAFDREGLTSQRTLVLTDGVNTETIQLSGGGYAH